MTFGRVRMRRSTLVVRLLYACNFFPWLVASSVVPARFALSPQCYLTSPSSLARSLARASYLLSSCLFRFLGDARTARLSSGSSNIFFLASPLPPIFRARGWQSQLCRDRIGVSDVLCPSVFLLRNLFNFHASRWALSLFLLGFRDAAAMARERESERVTEDESFLRILLSRLTSSFPTLKEESKRGLKGAQVL